MVREAIYHRPRNNYAYFTDAHTATLLLRAKRGDLAQAQVCVFDKYNSSATWQVLSLSLLISDELFDYFEISTRPPYRRLAYYFHLRDQGGEALYFDELGFHRSEKRCRDNAFQIPYLNPTDAIAVPEWAKSAVFYQIFPDSFARAGAAGADLPPWGSEPHLTGHLGGNLRGIIQRFDYIRELGINAIYFCPVFQANTCHRYDTTDYYSIDPRLGTLEEFRELLELCHRNGVRVLLDAVFNHTCDAFPQFLDVVEKGEDSPYRDWYFIHQYPVRVDEEYRYERFAFERHMPKLNTAHPPVREYLLDIARYWTRQGIDGWRLDVANEIDLDFWRTFRRAVKEINPDAFLLGEMWNDSQPYLNGDMVDSVMNYPFAAACQQYFLDGEISSREFQALIAQRLVCYPRPMAYSMYNLLGSHDTPRWLTLAGGDWNKVKLSYLFQFSGVGMPAIYYGDETGMTGEDFVQARRCMEFEPAGHGRELLEFFRGLVRLRTGSPALWRGSFSWVELQAKGGDPVCIRRRSGEEEVLVLLNNSGERAALPPGTLPGLSGEVEVAPMGYRIWKNGEETTL